MISAALDDGAGRVAVQCVGVDQFFVQGRTVEGRLGGAGLFAASGDLFLVDYRHRIRGSVLVVGQDQQAHLVADHLAVHGQGQG